MKKKRSNNRSDKKYKIGDLGSIFVDRVLILIEVVDIDHATQEYRCYSLNPGDMRIFWVPARDIRRYHG
ncbi:MAG: hypothetical protein E3J23_08535 [Candidatus Stahlbacteria bacterium]|nr:MAG: hypothetical protein E3J23_08535 [Candidatus Stahlbacteria bacterium]